MANTRRVVLLCATFILLTGRVLGDDNFDLSDALSFEATTKPSPVKPRNPSGGAGIDTSDFGSDFDLSDALDDSNDNYGKGGKGDSGSKGNDKPKGGKKPGTAGISDKDLEDLLGGGDYKPDKKKSGDNAPSNDQDQVAMPETTVAGIVSAVAAALLGAVSSYIAYQKKQLCFKIQGNLNQQYVKGENAEAGTVTEPQADRSLLQTQSEKPPADNANQI
ncbi:CD99 antigen-like protein 2 isoform X4 [Heterodontus francisci]|uniref:CD99 antigen-like protein 2 isoform X4 n=1 Tax=Heterodontus francisci TaxID=7792 RepID=UPI00355BB1E4